jgi:hypothetical protein
MCLLARSDDPAWVSTITAWVHPSHVMTVSFRSYGCPPCSEGHILLVIADTDRASWVHPSRDMGVPLRVRGSPIDHEGSSPPSEAVTHHE